MEPPIKTYFSTKEPHRFVLFLAVITLMFSLFVESHNVTNAFLQRFSFTFVILGLIWWLVFDAISFGISIYEEKERRSERQLRETIIRWHIFWIIFFIATFIWGLVIAF